MRGYDVMVACQLPKLNARVRFPLPAPSVKSTRYKRFSSLQKTDVLHMVLQITFSVSPHLSVL